MKKLLGIVVLGLLLSGNAYALTFKYMFKTKIKCEGFYWGIKSDGSSKETPAGDIYLAFDKKIIMTDWDSINQEFKQKYKIIFYILTPSHSVVKSLINEATSSGLSSCDQCPALSMN